MSQQTRSAPRRDASKQRLAYDWYIKSARWERRKVAYYARHPKVCRACGAKEQIHLHHHTYKRMGVELDADLVPLCEPCHVLVHRHHRDHRGWTLTRATADFLRLNGSSLRPGRRKPARRQRQKRPAMRVFPTFSIGDSVMIKTEHKHLSWANGRKATVVIQLSPTTWQVEFDDRPGSRFGITGNTATRLRSTTEGAGHPW